MSTSDKRAYDRSILRYLAAAALCAAFGFIYESFGHGVSSAWMTRAFLFPLLGGAGVLGVLRGLPAGRRPQQTARALYGSGLAALTVGSLLTGVFEIYGSAAPLVSVYWPLGGFLMAVGAAVCLAQRPPRPFEVPCAQERAA